MCFQNLFYLNLMVIDSILSDARGESFLTLIKQWGEIRAKKPHSYILASYRIEPSRKTFCGVCARLKPQMQEWKLWPKESLLRSTSHRTTSLIDFLFQTHRFFCLACEEVIKYIKSQSLYLADIGYLKQHLRAEMGDLQLPYSLYVKGKKNFLYYAPYLRKLPCSYN